MFSFPVSGETFDEIIDGKFIYVDKTEYIFNLIKNKCLFLSRPRRFGKSLLLAAIEQLFLGQDHCFKNLWIGQKDRHQFVPHPVINITMSGSFDSKERLEKGIASQLADAASDNGLKIERDEPSLMLREIFSAIKEKNGKKAKVVILIDDYDQPILSVLKDSKQIEENHSALHSFYGTLKSYADHGNIRFLFVTGVTRFAKASFFSVFNNCYDLTMDPAYAAVCGFTVEEFDAYLAGFLPGILERLKADGSEPVSTSLADLRERVFTFYGGYSWDGKTRVLNPFSLVNFLSRKIIKPYWHFSGAPTFLIDMIRDNQMVFNRAETYSFSELDLEASDPTNLRLVPVLFQSGYLTVDKLVSGVNYLLREPNQEVRECLNFGILDALTGQSS